MSRKRKPQEPLPGVEISEKPKVTKAAKAYLEARKDFQAAAEVVAKAKQRLMDVMRDEEVGDTYICQGLSIQITHGKDGIKVRELEDEEAA